MRFPRPFACAWDRQTGAAVKWLDAANWYKAEPFFPNLFALSGSGSLADALHRRDLIHPS